MDVFGTVKELGKIKLGESDPERDFPDDDLGALTVFIDDGESD